MRSLLGGYQGNLIPGCCGWWFGDCWWFLGGGRPDRMGRCSTFSASTLRHVLEKEKGEKEKDVPSDLWAWADGCFAVLQGNRAQRGRQLSLRAAGRVAAVRRNGLAPPTLRHTKCVQVAVSQSFSRHLLVLFLHPTYLYTLPFRSDCTRLM